MSHDNQADMVLNVLRTINKAFNDLDHPPYQTITTTLEYEHFIEQPRRAGRDPAWQAALNEALTGTADAA